MSYPLPAGARLERYLGAGSVFDVAVVDWRGRRCVSKRLRSTMRGEPRAHAALQREALLLDLARHASLPALVARGEDAHGPYLVESCQSGVSWRRLVEAWRTRGRPVPARLVNHLLAASFSALAELHATATCSGPLELVHGDLCPDHLLLGPADEIHFIDLGQARWASMDPALAGDDRGTLPYVAPEVARGESPPDQAADVFALAATVAFVALGREPCGQDSPAARLVEVAEQGVDTAALRACANVEPRLRTLLVEALAFEPARRLRSAADVCCRLQPA